MELFKGIFITAFVLHIMQVTATAQKTPGQNDSMGEEQGLRKMLKTVMEQNRKLVLQNNRLQQVWFGMQQMCKALSMSTCDCSVPLSNLSSTVSNQSALPLQVISIRSSGVNSGSTTVNIVYAATPDTTTEWIGPQIYGGIWRTSGKKTQTVPGSTLFASTVEIEELQSFQTMFFRLYNEEESVNVRLNLTEIEKHQIQNVTAPTQGLLKVNSTYTAPLESDFNITVIVNKDRDLYEIGFAEVFFTGLNTSASPTELFEIYFYNSDEIDLSLSRRTNTTSNMVITLRYPYAQYGGILTVRMPYHESMTGMVEELFYGPFIKIHPPDSKEVIPRNALGVFPLPKQTIIFPPMQSIMCAAMGNPRPNVSVLRVVDDDKTKEMETETVILDSYMNQVVLSLSAKQPRKKEGRYICRATNGNKTIEASTEVIGLRPAVIDENKTGVIKNTSKIIVISCKAKGKPKPKLSLNLYEEHGPDLIRSGMYKYNIIPLNQVWVWRRYGHSDGAREVSKSVTTKFSSRVTVTISPVNDPDIHTVYCVADQGEDPNGGFEVNSKINIYPGLQRENNWELFYRLQDSQVF